jgi:hypothetical protein
MTQMSFTRATKKQARARIAFEGPSGSGKTYTSLITAKVLGERVALIDTEHRSASLYADEFTFDTLQLDKYDPQMLVDALAVAAGEGYDVVIIDSLSHFWMGTDGMLEQVDKATKRAGRADSFGSGWKDMAPVERRMVEAILAYPGHVIVTMRQKTEWVIEDKGGKKVPRKIGMKAVQRDGIEYEFTIVGDLDHENELVISKSRCKKLAGAVIRRPDEEFGRTILGWLNDGDDAGVSAFELRDAALDKHAGRDELVELYKRAQAHALLGAPVLDGHGDPTTLGELITALGRAAADRRAAPDIKPDSGSGGKVTSDQHKRMHALWRKLKLDGEANRDQRLLRTAEIVDRPVDSSADLTEAEANRVITALEQAVRELADVGVGAGDRP